MESNEFMLNLQSKLKEEKKVAESTANAYVRVLYTLNEKKPYKNLTFLKDVPAITARMEKYADSTKDSVLGAISSVLSLFSGKPSMAKLYKEYHEMYAAKSKEVKADLVAVTIGDFNHKATASAARGTSRRSA
jgi:hypothetical protein